MEEKRTFFIEDDLNGQRIDKAVSECDGSITRSRAEQLIAEGRVFAGELPVKKPSYRVRTGEQISVIIPEPEITEILPEDIPLDVVYEDDDIVIVNKPKGMVVHPAPGHYSGTLVNALMYHCRDSLSGINGDLRPGIVHRIDRDTTGVLVVCKNDKSHLCLSEQLAVHSIKRVYYCIVNGIVKEDGTVDAPIGRNPNDRKKMAIVKDGRRAVSHYHVLRQFGKKYTLLSCELETGRTHQIRVHMASIGHSLLGDTVYGSAKQPYDTNGQVLHAGVLGFKHPADGRYVEFEAPLPDYFKELIDKLGKIQ
ncbi:MAG: RluA family pseudouridine synthase [Lachnospiraceae bacterium]|nr:RluA family pseudouridine synthase [Lachnospiraceae bacterium]